MFNRIDWIKVAVFFAGLIIIVMLLMWMTGCAETQSDFTRHTKIIDPVTGLVVYESRTDTGSFARAPDDAALPTTQTLGESGTASSVSGVHTKTADQIIAANGRIFYYAAAGFALLAVLGFAVLKSSPIALGCGVAAGACALTPVFLNQVGPWLLPIGGVGLVGGLLWYMANRRASDKSSRIAAAELHEAQRLKEQGKLVEALDKMDSGIVALAVNKPVFAKEIGKK